MTNFTEAYSISIHGDTIAAGIRNAVPYRAFPYNYSGGVFIYKRTGTTWNQEASLAPANATAGLYFGDSVDLEGDTVAIGAFGEASSLTTVINGTGTSSDTSQPYAGAAYIFKRTGTTWAQEAYLKAPNNSTNNWFGRTVSISGDSVFVGARNEQHSSTSIINFGTVPFNNSANFHGAGYIFSRIGTTWEWEAYLKPSPIISPAYRCGGDEKSVLSGDTVIFVCDTGRNNILIRK